MYAQVAVNRPVHQTFDYHIPPDLAENIQPGHMVEVSFGTAMMTGIVVSISKTSSIPNTKPVRRRLDPQPVLTPQQLELAWWLVENTLTPIGLCIWLMLPPGLPRQSETLYHLLDEDAEGDSFSQQRIISLLKNRGDLDSNQLKRALPKMNWQAAMSPLLERGIVEREDRLKPPTATPKTRRAARLAISAKIIPAIATSLGRESRRASVLEVLRAARDYTLSLEDTMALADCTDSPIRTLDKSGDVRLSAKQRFVELIYERETLAQEMKQGEFDNASNRKAVLETLLASENPLPREDFDVPASVLNDLEEMGYVQTWEEPAAVELLIAPENVPERIIELRGAHKYLDILHYLAKFAGSSVPFTQIYEDTDSSYNEIKRLARDGFIVLGDTEVIRDPLDHSSNHAALPPPLTSAQAEAWNIIRDHQQKVHWEGDAPSPETPHTFLLHGVTGSGKTEIYMRAVAQALAQGRQAIVLVPEIALTSQLSQRFAARFPVQVSVIHSGLSIGERFDTWRRARDGEIQIILGARSALFAPLPDIGLIVLDEEHDDSYKQSPPFASPHYHAREVAIEYMRLNRGTVILGSATPDVTTMYRAEHHEFKLLSLPDRVLAHRDQIAWQTVMLNLPQARYEPAENSEAMSAELPPVDIVDMRQELRAGNRSVFSRLLQQRLTECLSRNEQALLFLNRRGTSTFVMCRNCGYIARCPNCDTPLTYHTSRQALICHYCAHQSANPTTCPECDSKRIRYFGSGTEQIDHLLQDEFPETRVLRWDQDTASQKGAHERILQTFMKQEADVLVGTQMIAKGLDIPLVTLVGVISADTALGLPDYRTGERTFQLLTQVAGRAGRGLLNGRVVFQTYQPNHYAIQTAAEHDYHTFYEHEMYFRQQQQYPPYMQMARILFQEKTLDAAQHEAAQAAAILRTHVKNFSATEIIGPTPCFFMRRDNVFRWQVLVRSANAVRVLRDVELPGGAVIDIHPTDLL